MLWLLAAVWAGGAGAGTVIGADPPSGEVIYFARASDQTTMAVRPDGTGLVDTGCPGDRTHQGAPRRALRWEPTGETFQVVSGTGWSSVTVARLVSRTDTCGDPVVLWEPGTGYQFDSAVWSIDGHRVAFTGRRHDALGQIAEQGVWVGEVGGSCGQPLCDVHLAVAFPTVVQVVRPDGLVSYAAFGGQARWSPDDRRVVYSRVIDPLVPDPVYGIHVADVGRPGEAGSGEHRVIVAGMTRSQYAPAFSPVEGSDQIAFTATITGKGPARNEIFVIPSVGGPARQVTSTKTANILQILHPAWSPDGRSIAFAGASWSAGRSSIFRIGADGSTKAQLVATWPGSNLYVPSWRR